jgi:hypothetical protein
MKMTDNNRICGSTQEKKQEMSLDDWKEWMKDWVDRRDIRAIHKVLTVMRTLDEMEEKLN